MSARSVLRLGRPEKRRLERTVRSCRDAALATRVRIVLLYGRGEGATTISRVLACAPATVSRVVQRYRGEGMNGLVDRRGDNGVTKVDADVLQALAEILERTAEEWGWKRPTWTRELLAQQLERETGVQVSVTTVARMLRRLRARWGMARPVVACPWSRERKQRRMRQIRHALEDLPPGELAFYEDEVDIHLNPKIGRDWMLRGHQRAILTPGQNKKRYVAGVVSVDGRELFFVEAEKKNSDLFLLLLIELRRRHPRARRIHLVLDNYCIHSSRHVLTYLEHAGRCFQLHFLPPYCPDENRIERVWRELHANVTRNHRCRTMEQLMGRVRWYLRSEDRRRRCQPMPRRPRRKVA